MQTMPGSLAITPKETLGSKAKAASPVSGDCSGLPLTHGHNFLIVVDCYTDWPDIVHMGHDTTTTQLNKALLGVFRRTGEPDIVLSDEHPSLHLNVSETSQRNGDFTIAYPHPCTHRATAKLSQQSSP